MKKRTLATAVLVWGLLLMFSARVPKRTLETSTVGLADLWSAHRSLISKIVWASLNRWLLLYLLVAEIVVLGGTLLQHAFPIEPNARATYVVALVLFAAATLLVGILLYFVLSSLFAALAVDQIGWEQIRRCLSYIQEDKRLSDADRLGTIHALAESGTTAIWGSITVLGIFLGAVIAIVLSEAMKTLPMAWQLIILTVGAVSGFAASFQVIVANSNTVIARAVVLWQKDPKEAQRIAEAYAKRKSLRQRFLPRGTNGKRKT